MAHISTQCGLRGLIDIVVESIAHQKESEERKQEAGRSS